MAWKTIYRPMSMGGLGVIDSHFFGYVLRLRLGMATPLGAQPLLGKAVDVPQEAGRGHGCHQYVGCLW